MLIRRLWKRPLLIHLGHNLEITRPSKEPDSIGDVSEVSRVKMSCNPFYVSSFTWIQRFSTESCQHLRDSGYSADSHVFREACVSHDDELAHRHCIVDFGRNTYRVMKDVRTFEDIRLNDFRVGRVTLPSNTIFPGAQRAWCSGSLVLREPGAQGVDGPTLSPDIAPLKFPGNN